MWHQSSFVSSMAAVALSYDPALRSIRDHAPLAKVYVWGHVHTLDLVSNKLLASDCSNVTRVISTVVAPCSGSRISDLALVAHP